MKDWEGLVTCAIF